MEALPPLNISHRPPALNVKSFLMYPLLGGCCIQNRWPETENLSTGWENLLSCVSCWGCCIQNRWAECMGRIDGQMQKTDQQPEDGHR